MAQVQVEFDVDKEIKETPATLLYDFLYKYGCHDLHPSISLMFNCDFSLEDTLSSHPKYFEVSYSNVYSEHIPPKLNVVLLLFILHVCRDGLHDKNLHFFLKRLPRAYLPKSRFGFYIIFNL